MTNNVKIEVLLSEVLQELTPRDDERAKVNSIVNEVTQKINEICKQMNVKARAELQGSVAKDTWISGDKDIDIFIIFSKDTPTTEVRTLGLQIARKAAGTNYVECYAEHPYVRAFINSYTVDIVPCSEFDLSSGRPQTATDRTPLHTRFIKDRLVEHLKGEVRLLKGFMKGIGAYGAEIKISGFSGYLCELLTLHYGSFLNVVSNAKSWKPFSTVIDLVNHYDDPKQALKIFKSPLVVIDPIDKNRNVAAALSLEKLALFMLACHVFTLKPSKMFFKPETHSMKEATRDDVKKYLEKSKTTLLAIATTLEPSPPDILWGQIKRSCNGIVKLLEHEGFKVLRWSAWSDDWGESITIIEVESPTITPTVKHLGPPIASMEDVMKFLIKHTSSQRTVAGPYIEGDRLVVLTSKRASDVVSFLRNNIHKAELSKEFAEALKRRFDIAVNEEIIDVCKKECSKYRLFVTSYLRGSPHWLQLLQQS